MKDKSIPLIFKTEKEMDHYLENTDLGPLMEKYGVWKDPLIKKVNLDFPPDIVAQIDRVASKIGVSRQPLLKMWIYERLKQELPLEK